MMQPNEVCGNSNHLIITILTVLKLQQKQKRHQIILWVQNDISSSVAKAVSAFSYTNTRILLENMFMQNIIYHFL